jgi:hypothetical protein
MANDDGRDDEDDHEMMIMIIISIVSVLRRKRIFTNSSIYSINYTSL